MSPDSAAHTSTALRASLPGKVLKFVFHQFMGTLGTAFLAAFALESIYDLPKLFNADFSMRPVHWLLTENPYYPVQIILGFYLGWRLGRRFPTRGMSCVFVLPLLLLEYAVATNLVLIPHSSSVLMSPGVGRSRFSYYFGSGCQPRFHCLDQLLLTMPFYVSAAYSLGTVIASRNARMPVIQSASPGSP
jgi:hypothetical protein